MRFMIQVRATISSEIGAPPGQVCEIEVRQLYDEADFAPGGDMALPAGQP